MWGAVRRIDRLLLHPWTTRVGAAQAIVGAGILAAGLVGGAVTLVLGFPLGWAILSAIGAFLLIASGVGTLIERYREQQLSASAEAPGQSVLPEEKKELRKAISWILDDLEALRARMESALERGTWWWEDWPDLFSWTERGEIINALGYHDEHRSVRKAIRLADDLHRYGRSIRTAEPEEWQDLDSYDVAMITAAVEALNVAEADLDRIQR